MSRLKIIAHSDNEVYLLDAGTDDHDRPVGRILDLEQGKLFPPYFIHSLIAQGGWEPYTGEQSELTGLLARVTEVPLTVASKSLADLVREQGAVAWEHVQG